MGKNTFNLELSAEPSTGFRWYRWSLCSTRARCLNCWQRGTGFAGYYPTSQRGHATALK
jgi:hypothetical protein